MEVTWGADGVVGVPAGVGLHRLSIVGPWLVPKGSCEVGTCQNLAGKTIPRLVEGSKSMIVDLWIQDHSIVTIGVNQHWINI